MKEKESEMKEREIFKHFELFGLHFYVSSRRMKRTMRRDEKLKRHRAELARKKRLLYGMQGGRCELCGAHFGPNELEIHHIVGVAENPGLALQTKNLTLLCHGCHLKVHESKERSRES